MRRKMLSIVLLLFPSMFGIAQEIQFSQFYASPLYLNPAMVGLSPGHRAAVNYRNQWVSIPNAYTSYAASYDVNLMELNSGVGVAIHRDVAGPGGLSVTNVGGFYSYVLYLSEELTVRPAIGITYTNQAIDYTKLKFGDQLVSGANSSSNYGAIEKNRGYMDISTGFMFRSKVYYFGYSAYHINEPNNSLMGSVNKIAPKHSIHGGVKLPIVVARKGDIISSFTLMTHYKTQREWHQADVGFQFDYRPFITGIWYRGIPLKGYKPGERSKDAMVFLTGVKYQAWKFGYSYDMTVSQLWGNTGGSHEVSLSYIIKRKPKFRRKWKQAPCPEF